MEPEELEFAGWNLREEGAGGERVAECVSYHVAKYLKFASRRKDLTGPMVSVYRQLALLFWAQDRQIMMIRNTRAKMFTSWWLRRRENKKEVGMRHVLQRHTSNDLLSPTKPHLLQFPPTPNNPSNYKSTSRKAQPGDGGTCL